MMTAKTCAAINARAIKRTQSTVMNGSPIQSFNRTNQIGLISRERERERKKETEEEMEEKEEEKDRHTHTHTHTAERP